MSGHTPGPWVAERFGSITAVVAGARRQVASATGDAVVHGPATLSTTSIQEANARLIAAAPELDLLKVEELHVGAHSRLHEIHHHRLLWCHSGSPGPLQIWPHRWQTLKGRQSTGSRRANTQRWPKRRQRDRRPSSSVSHQKRFRFFMASPWPSGPPSTGERTRGTRPGTPWPTGGRLPSACSDRQGRDRDWCAWSSSG